MIKEIPRIVRQLPDGATAMYAWFQAMHTRVDILLRHTGPAACDLMQRAIDEMREVIASLEQAGNCFSPGSELFRLNHLNVGERMELSPALFDILSECIRYQRLTEGLFDVSVDPACHRGGMLPYLDLRDDHTASRLIADITLNLSGFLKGYALDRMREVVKQHGIHDALLNMGNSSIMSLGDVPFHLKNGCLTTSGNTTGHPSHIINPRSGQYVQGERSVTVMTDNGTDGEVASTVMFICQPEEKERLMSVLNVRSFTENLPEKL